MRFVNPLPFVADIARSKAFYRDVLLLRIIEDDGNFVRFENGFALHEGTSLHHAVFGEPAVTTEPYGRRNLVLYFEDGDLDAAFTRIVGQVDLIHAIRREPWGGRLFRFFDPDRHVIEIGEPDE